MKKEVDLVVSGGRVLLMDEADGVVSPGMVVIDQGLIVAVGSKRELEHLFNPRTIIRATDSLIMPGLINSHVHAPMTCFRGIADDLPLFTWWNDYIFPVESRHVNEHLVYWGTLLACAEMIRSGTTTFADMYFFEDQVARAAVTAGMRCVVAEGLLDFPTPNAKNPADGLRYTENLIEEWSAHPLVNIYVGPHALYTCSPSLLTAAGELAASRNLPIGIHLLENEAERDIIRQKHNLEPFQILRETGLLSDRLMAYHGVYLQDAEIEDLATHGAKVVHNPESNMKLGSGMAPMTRMIKAGVTLGLGTDGAASNNDLDMFGEMDSAAKLEKVARRDPALMPARTVVRMATVNGANLLGLPSIGRIAPGMKADLIVIGLNKPHLTPLYQEYSHLVYSVKGSDVDTVIINGRLVMHNRVLLTFDEREAMAKVMELSGQIKLTLSEKPGDQER